MDLHQQARSETQFVLLGSEQAGQGGGVAPVDVDARIKVAGREAARLFGAEASGTQVS